jgi:hypothetical protein
VSHSQRETLLVRRIRRAIEERWPAAVVVKIAGGPYQQSGLPDLLVILLGRLICLEVKAPQPGESEEHARSRATVLQQATLDRLHEAGAITAVVVSVEEALALVAQAEVGMVD